MGEEGKFEELAHEVYQVLNEMTRQQEELDNFGSEIGEIPEYKETVQWLGDKMNTFAKENDFTFKKA